MFRRIGRRVRSWIDWLRSWRGRLSWSARQRVDRLERPRCYVALAALAVVALAWTHLPKFVSHDGSPECVKPDRSDCQVVCSVLESPNRSGDDVAELVVLLHAFTNGPADMKDIRRVANHPKTLPDADVLICDLPFGATSVVSPDKVTADLVREIERAWDGGKYRDLRLVGHSLGALFARKLYVVGSGESEKARLEPGLKGRLLALGLETVPAREGEPLLAPRPWAESVERIVLMAGMNRGWSISHHMGLLKALKLQAGVTAGAVLVRRFDREPLVYAARRGSSFLTNLRIQWLEMKRRSKAAGSTSAMVIQLLGTVDDLVSPEDNIDLVTGREFFYLDVPRSGHKHVIEMDFDPVAEDASEMDRWEAEARQKRAGVFQLALSGSRATLCRKQIEQEGGLTDLAAECGEAAVQPAGDLPVEMVAAAPDALRLERPVTDVVFVIHGIRDKGHWTQKIARRVKARARKTRGKRVESVTATYGYFPMLPFLRPHARRLKVEWLMDRYTETYAQYPHAKFHYVGHSNGTYLLAKALESYPSVRFHRVVFVGSVVRTDYSWAAAEARGQVERVLNIPASEDWVVAFFPKAFELAELQDLGSAGHDGFQSNDAGQDERRTSTVVQPELWAGGEYVRAYARGGHGEALGEEYWESIASFVIDDPVPDDYSRHLAEQEALQGRFVTAHSGWVSFFGAGAQYLGLAILLVLTAVPFWLARLGIQEWQRTLLIVSYLFLIWTVVTRV